MLSGDWTVARGAPRAADVLPQLRAQAARELGFDCNALGSWDSLLVTLLLGIDEECTRAGIRLDTANLPEGALRLMALARTVRREQRAPSARAPWWRRLLAGEPLLQAWGELLEALAFLGELLIALGKLCVGRANTRARDFLWFVQQAGPAAIGIVTLISVLVGMILAYLGSVQLRQFGAQIYVADLVGIGMVREMAALMTGVIMAGRTGAAYAAQLGTMQTREEIDAIRTLGMSPMEFLVLPRLLALVLVMPLLSPLQRRARHVRRRAGGDRDGRVVDAVPARDAARREPDAHLDGAREERGLRAADRARRLPRGHAVRAQFRGGGQGNDQGGGHRHRVADRRRRGVQHRLPAAGDLSVDAPQPHIEVRGLTMAYGSRVIQKDLDFTVNRGDIFVIMGGSGCGKSTLLQAHDRPVRARRRGDPLRRRELPARR